MANYVWNRLIEITDANGVTSVAANADIEVRNAASGALATLYSDRAGTTTISNPTSADSDGVVEFYVVGGRYNITATKDAENRVFNNELIGIGLPDWDSAQDFIINDIVHYNGVIYLSNTNNNSGNNPESSPDNWRKIPLLVDTIEDLAAISTAGFTGRVEVSGYHSIEDGGGGSFVWGQGVHNGGTIIDPDRTFPTDWTNSTQVTTWFDTSGGTVNAWVRINYGRLHTSMFGIFFDSDDTYAAINTIALNALSTVVDGQIVKMSKGECINNGWDLSGHKGFILSGSGKAFGTTTPGSKLVFLPLTGTAIDIRGCTEAKFKDFCLDGGWIQENDPGSVPGDYPDSVTSIGFQSSNATYIDYQRLNVLRLSKGITTDPFHATDSITVYTINVYSCQFSACHYAFDYGYQCNNFNMFGGLITNCAYGVRWQNGGANVNFWGVDLQVQGYDQRAEYWEEADSHLFSFTKNQQVGLHGCYMEINGNDYANGQQYIGELDQVQGFKIDGLYIASQGSADPSTFMINANDSVGIEISGISPYTFPANVTWVNCTGTTNPVLVHGRNNVFHSGHKLVDNSYAPVLYLNDAEEAGATYGGNNEGVAIFDGRTLVYKGLLEVTNWGSLTAGGVIGIELPAPISPDTAVLNNVLASGVGYDAAGGDNYVTRILAASSDQVKPAFASSLNGVTQTDAPATVYFEIRYEPYMENI